MKYLLTGALLFVGMSPAFAISPAPGPDMDLGLASIVMVVGAAAIVYFRRRKG